MVLQEILFTLWQNFLTHVPSLIYSIVWLIIGFLVGKAVGRIVKEFLVRVKLDQYVVENEKIKLKLSDAFSSISKWIIYFVFISIAADTLGVQIIIDLVEDIVNFLTGTIKASVIIIVGYSLATYIKEKVLHSNTVYGDILGKLMFLLILYLSISLALPFVGINTQLTDQLLLVIVGSMGVGIAIALGFGLKPLVEEAAKKYAKKFYK